MRHFLPTLLLFALACKNDSAAKPDSVPASPGATTNPTAPAAGGSHAQVSSASSGLMPQQVAPRALDKLANGHVALGPFSVAVPANWQETPSASSMRAAEFQLASDTGKAEVIVYYFGESGAGTVQDNVDRWVNQFKQEGGKPSSEVAKIEQAKFAGQDAHLVSVSGHYVAPAMPGGEPIDKADQALIAAIVASPRGPYYFRLIGDRSVVSAQTPAFRQMLASLELPSPKPQ
jgi:hypothetical protein